MKIKIVKKIINGERCDLPRFSYTEARTKRQEREKIEERNSLIKTRTIDTSIAYSSFMTPKCQGYIND